MRTKPTMYFLAVIILHVRYMYTPCDEIERVNEKKMCQRDALHSTDVNMLIFRKTYPIDYTIIIINTKEILFTHVLRRAYCVLSCAVLYQSDTSNFYLVL